MADRSVVYRLIADASGVLAGTRQASLATKKFANDITASTKEGEKLRKGFDDIGKTAGRIGLVAAAGLGLMAARASDFESAMSNVEAATHETESNMRLLREAALEAGAATQFSATEAAEAVTELAKAGVQTADILGENGALNGALALAAAGQIEVADAAEFTATALTQFQLDGQAAAHVADLLAAGAGKAQGEVTDMALALNYAGVPAANLGISIEETAGSIALLASNGLVGEKAGTALRGMLASLTSPSEKAKKTMRELGIEMFDAEGEFVGLAGVAETLQTRMAGLTEEQRSNALGIIFGTEQLQAANVLYREGGEAVQEWTSNVDDAGFAAETAAIKTDNLRGDLERLGGAIDTALISGGQGSQGFLRELTQGATGAVDVFNKMDPALQNVVTGMLAVTAITGGALWFGSKVVRGIADTRESLENLGPAGAKARRGLVVATKAAAGLTLGLVAYQEATRLLNIGISDEDIRRTVELMDARSGPDVEARIRATTEAIKEQQAISDSEFGVNIGVAKLFPFDLDSSAANATDAVDGLTKHLVELRHEQELADIASGNFAATLPLLGNNLRPLGVIAGQAADANGEMAVTVVEAGRAVTYTADQIKAAREAYQEQKDAAREIGGEFFGLGEKVDKARVSLGRWITDLEKQAKALEDFTVNAEKAAKDGLDRGLIRSLQEAGPAGALRLEQLANASEREIDRANRAWRRGQKAIDDYVKATTKIPKPLRVEADTRQASAAIGTLKAQLAGLRSAHMEVRLGAAINRASGGYVAGPGSGTSDSIPAYLSNGEYVIKAAAVARYGVAMFDRLNAMHFAQGGYVGGSAPDFGPIVAALSQRQAPLANVINMQPHDYNDFERIKGGLRSAASMDGGRV